MNHPEKGTNPMTDKPGWRKSSFSNGASACVQVVMHDDDGRVCVRDSKDPGGPTLTFTAAEWQAFLDGVAAGEFALPGVDVVGEIG